MQPTDETGRTLAWKALLVTAKVAAQQGDHDQAEQMYRRALDNAEKRHGPENIAIASILMELADYYDNSGRKSDSEQLYSRVRDILSSYARELLDGEEP